MAPTRPRTRSSVGSSSPSKNAMAEVVPLRSGSPTAHPRSPIKKRTPGTITMQQKQAMIDNMQLEITERARRLRAQYNYMATTVRSRIEMRLNRIPMSMRNVKMGDLLQKYMEQEKQRAARSAATRKPPTTARITSPVKHSQPSAHNFKPSTRTKRMSDAISGDKENEIEHNENAKKKVRGVPNGDVSLMRPAQVLSPTSSNSRMANRPVSPIKSGIARPASPLKNPSQSRSAAAANMLTSMVEKAKASRGGVARKVTTSSTISTNSNTVAAAKNKKVPANATSRPPVSRPATRTGRRSIANSESSETSNGTVIRKASAAKGAPAKKGATASRKGAATGGVRKTTAAKANASTASTGTGRVLRKRA